RLVDATADGIAELLGPPPPQERSAAVPRPRRSGPFNLRRFLELAPPEARRTLEPFLAADRGGGYAQLLALARGVDGRRDVAGVIRWAACASELPIHRTVARSFLAALDGATGPDPEDAC
ncbi:MAG TPA: hypothetical protein VGD67_08770, partial [Pseudonocardiaceae bacterium]